MDNVTDSAEVTERLGTDERGYERDEYESFGTDGGSLTGGSFGAVGMETPNVSKMGEQAVKEHDAGVAKKEAEKMDKVTEAPEVAPRLGTDERGYERDDDDSFGTAPVSTGGGPDSPTTANMGYVDRAKGLVNKYWYGNEAAPELDDDVRKFADAKAEERKKDESHEKSNAGVADQK
ncbi:hypothetical protein MKW94_002101 [Papaver nudicaule]|uniref:Uncharacterized protein n=1 Tax=Papaver nudicaule TaxID=74823 RepID=A0AA41RTL8_PAPNU|nr:hypothetical protein [Papaver nudicaule]